MDAAETGVTREEIELSIDICAQIKRTLLFYRLYGNSHEQARQHEGTTFQKIKVFTDEYGSLNLDVTPDALCVGPRKVLQDDESGQEPIVACLFADGIKRVSIDAGVSTVEVARLLQQWSTAIRGHFATDYSFSSALWEDDLKHVYLTTLDAIGEGGIDDDVDSLAARMDEILRGLRGEESASPLRVAPARCGFLRGTRACRSWHLQTSGHGQRQSVCRRCRCRALTSRM